MAVIYDLVILGSGPAGLGAAIYAQRAELKTLVIEKEMVSGGQVLSTYEVDNYAGLPGIGGFDLGMKFREHADKLGAEFAEDVVLRIEDADAAELDLVQAAEAGAGLKKVIGENETYYAKTVIIATGAQHRKLGVPGEEELVGMGVSYCATCDGAFYKGKTVVIVGGGNTAVADAIFLAKICEKVYLVHRRDELRASKTYMEALEKTENIEFIWSSEVVEIEAEQFVTGVKVKSRKDDSVRQVPCDGIFVAIGNIPNTDLIKGQVELDEAGYVLADETTKTNIPGVFAVGDMRQKPLRQIVTAVADGAVASKFAEEYVDGV